MHEVEPGALSAFGWSERVLALYSSSAEPGDEPGRVVRVERSHTVVVGPNGDEHVVTAPVTPAVGDWAVVSDDVIRCLLERWSALTRADPDGTGTQVLAANVDLVFITVPGDRFSISRVERELAIAWESGARPVVVLTKEDLAPTTTLAALENRLAGVEVLATSARTKSGIDVLAAMLQPSRSAVLLGPSGAGKSTLTNALIGSDVLATGAVRENDRRGRHTTTTRQLVPVPTGGVLIDTPGLRSIALTSDALEQVFPEIATLAVGCRFSDCSHEVEPGCAVREAVASGELEAARLGSFHKLQREAAVEVRKHDALARQSELALWRQRAKDAKVHDKRRKR